MSSNKKTSILKHKSRNPNKGIITHQMSRNSYIVVGDARKEAHTPVEVGRELTLANDFSRSEKNTKERSISKEYLERTNKKRNSMSFSATRNKQSASFLGETSGNQQMMSQSVSVQEPILNHIMKQINSLKVENLELKKMISNNALNSRRPSKNVRIS